MSWTSTLLDRCQHYFHFLCDYAILVSCLEIGGLGDDFGGMGDDFGGLVWVTMAVGSPHYFINLINLWQIYRYHLEEVPH